ncbi:class I SAM-dependent methyltransferase [Salegentibacter salegens]|uniref:Ubiquinone/menaquinone biosynthesis C-methylase UbiE n=1 Tax=Salegentibacter salegens TaxID=143223 RepID=A0A1M7MBY1_9FLAO|nr:class I SAM-dependent methyltransferase [Salegentibacter salegens]PRX51583.1 ubiquinone/menaquinone biosynthesis C-methylase UbiE [Salegentibacter salegens]SHM87834.1 Ubiquinone/menaquinone biosynthesis C-methylase UbiE [Salegentibacter salegens]
MPDKNFHLTCKDHLVSGEEFQLQKRSDFDILETIPKPEDLSAYYESENYISHTDSSKSFTDKLYQGVKNFMLLQKLKWIHKVSKGNNLLDIGAGTGDFLLAANRKKWNVEGIEPNAQARKLAAEKGIELQQELSYFKDASFDVITMWHVLEHVPDLDFQLKELYRLLKPNGVAVIAVPNFKSFDAEYYKEFWAAYDVPRHLWHFSQTGINELFKRHNFEKLKTKPLVFDSFYVSLLSEKNKTGNSNMIEAFKIGVKSNLKAQSTSEYSSLVYFFLKS